MKIISSTFFGLLVIVVTLLFLFAAMGLGGGLGGANTVAFYTVLVLGVLNFSFAVITPWLSNAKDKKIVYILCAVSVILQVLSFFIPSLNY
ncbi:MAG: hypothetical protein RLZZ67_341 [Candidatus Parcubacteria bacterium]|jgi:hypothetical protein